MCLNGEDGVPSFSTMAWTYQTTVLLSFPSNSEYGATSPWKDMIVDRTLRSVSVRGAGEPMFRRYSAGYRADVGLNRILLLDAHRWRNANRLLSYHTQSGIRTDESRSPGLCW